MTIKKIAIYTQLPPNVKIDSTLKLKDFVDINLDNILTKIEKVNSLSFSQFILFKPFIVEIMKNTINEIKKNKKIFVEITILHNFLENNIFLALEI